MVELIEIQAVSYIVAALSFAVTCAYYIMNLKNTQRNMEMTLETRRIGVLQNLMSVYSNIEGVRSSIEQFGYEWKDYADFEKKYGTENNVEEASKRFATWNHWNSVGSMLRKGVVSIEDVWDTSGTSSLWLLEKYKLIVEEHRRRYTGKFYLKDWEYLAGEMSKYLKTLDPSYVVPSTLDKYIPDK